MIYPIVGVAPLANPDLPPDIKSDYDEARSISSMSPRGAAALLRLAIQKICIYLGGQGKDLNSDIAALVKKGLPEKVQKSLDTVRVIGNEALHPGQMDLRDDAKTVSQLFGLVNLIADVMITQPKKIDQIFEGLPESKREAIRKRDQK
jgi:hypothetical protein